MIRQPAFFVSLSPSRSLSSGIQQSSSCGQRREGQKKSPQTRKYTGQSQCSYCHGSASHKQRRRKKPGSYECAFGFCASSSNSPLPYKLSSSLQLLPVMSKMKTPSRILSQSACRSVHTVHLPDSTSSTSGSTHTNNSSSTSNYTAPSSKSTASSCSSTTPPPWPTSETPDASPTPYQLLSARPGQPYDKSTFYRLIKHYHPDRTSGMNFASQSSRGQKKRREVENSQSGKRDDNTANYTKSQSEGTDTAIRLERYRLLVAAHTLLSDPVARSTYDTYGVGWIGDKDRNNKSRNSSNGYPTRNVWPAGCDPMRNATWEDWEAWRERMHFHNKRYGAKDSPGGQGFDFAYNRDKYTGGYSNEYDAEYFPT